MELRELAGAINAMNAQDAQTAKVIELAKKVSAFWQDKYFLASVQQAEQLLQAT